MATDRPGSVLFACGMNSIRSPIASGLARHYYPTMYVRSAGVRRGQKDPFAIAIMEEMGLDITGHEPRTFEELEDSYFDLIITLAPEAHHGALELTRSMAVDVEYWPTQDPSLLHGSRDRILDGYRIVREQLATRIRKRFG